MEPEETKHQRIDSLKVLQETTGSVIANAKRTIQLYTRNLDPRILNNRDIESSCLRFIRSSRFVRMEILIIDEREMQGVDHRLVSLAQKFNTYVSIRLIPKDFHENYFAFYIVDGRHIIYRNMADRFEAEYHQPPSPLLNQKQKYFDEVWQQATPASALRSLFI